MAVPNRQTQVLGWFPPFNTVAQLANVNAAANWFALSFYADTSRTLSAFRTYVSGITGTLSGSDITCDLYDSTGTSGAPGSSIETGKTPTATITGAGWYTFNGFTTALTEGQGYWAVFKNANGTPASNYATFRQYLTNLSAQFGNSGRALWGRATSTNSGSNWTLAGPCTGLRVDYTTGYDGCPVDTIAATAVGSGVYSTREVGVVFTTPKLSLLRVAGLSINIGRAGVPTGKPRLRLWENQNGTPVVIATATNANAGTSTVPVAITNQFLFGYFDSSTIITMRPSTTYRITLGETTQSDGSGARFQSFEATWDSDSNSLALVPWGGTCQKTYFDGSSWTDTPGTLIPHGLLLDQTQEFFGVPQANYLLGI